MFDRVNDPTEWKQLDDSEKIEALRSAFLWARREILEKGGRVQELEAQVERLKRAVPGRIPQ